ncbi:putative L-iditol 2-dehydrogenase [Helianthus debilis subsp. tardiflorus]
MPYSRYDIPDLANYETIIYLIDDTLGELIGERENIAAWFKNLQTRPYHRPFLGRNDVQVQVKALVCDSYVHQKKVKFYMYIFFFSY